MSSSLEALPDPAKILVDFGSATPQRRSTVLFRLILAIPQFVLLGVLGFGAFFVVLYSWFGALIRGRAPANAARFLVGYLRRLLRLNAYIYLLTDAYPPLDSSAEYPADLVASPGPLNRLAVLFRVVLVLPAAIFSGLLSTGMLVFSVVSWLVTLISGKLPAPIFVANSLVVRYSIRATGYAMLLTSEWPWGSFGDRAILDDPPLPPLSTAWDTGPTAWSTPVPTAGATLSTDPSRTEAASFESAATRNFTLTSTRGVRVLLATYLVLGVAYQVIITPAQFNFSSSANALNATETAVAALNVTLSTTNTKALACPTTSERLGCLTKVLRDQAAAYVRLQHGLHSISFPTVVATEASGMEADVATDVTIYTALGQQTSLAAIRALALTNQPAITAAQTDFNTRYVHMRTLLLPF